MYSHWKRLHSFSEFDQLPCCGGWTWKFFTFSLQGQIIPSLFVSIPFSIGIIFNLMITIECARDIVLLLHFPRMFQFSSRLVAITFTWALLLQKLYKSSENILKNQVLQQKASPGIVWSTEYRKQFTILEFTKISLFARKWLELQSSCWLCSSWSFFDIQVIFVVKNRLWIREVHL